MCNYSEYPNLAFQNHNDVCEIIRKYFSLSKEQEMQFHALDALYREWNAKINVISRKDIDNLYLHHVLHSLAIAKKMEDDGLDRSVKKVLDFGCGGGFPGIPLAIIFPHIQFKLIDSIGKKTRVAQEVTDAIGLKNCRCQHLRGQDEKEPFDLIVSRAVMPLGEIIKIFPHSPLICLKGGNLNEETKDFQSRIQMTPVSNYFAEEWFEEKYVLSLK